MDLWNNNYADWIFHEDFGKFSYIPKFIIIAVVKINYIGGVFIKIGWTIWNISFT